MSEARIVYLPHCSKCGSVINGEVKVSIENDFEIDHRIDSTILRKPRFVFDPMCCQACGATFNVVVYPAPANRDGFASNMERYMEGVDAHDDTV